MKNALKGLYPALYTPFDKNNRIDFSALGELIEFCIEQGMDGFYVGGSTAECFLLSEEERILLYRETAKLVRGRVRLIAHVGHISTDLSLKFAKSAIDCGYDAISAVAPFYYSFSQSQIKKYYTDLSSAFSVPFVIYNFPANSGFSLTPEILSELLAQNPNIVAVKHTSRDMYQLERFHAMKADLTILNGYDECLLSGLAAGADGGIGSTYNFMPGLIKKVQENFDRQNIVEAKKYQTKINDVIDILAHTECFASASKFLLNCMGFRFGESRRPFTPISVQQRDKVEELADYLIRISKNCI